MGVSTAFRDYGVVPYVADPALMKHEDSKNDDNVKSQISPI
jgi:hypothetical protein